MTPRFLLASLIGLCLVFFTNSLAAQRFGVGLTLGTNLGQVDSDELFGYRHFGLQAGIIGTARIHDRSYLAVEMLYSQRGSKASNEERSSGISLQKLTLHYVEVPFLLHYKMAQDWDEEYRLALHGGFSYGRLLNAVVEEDLLEDAVAFSEFEDDFARDNISAIFGVTFYVKPRLGLTLRHSYALRTLDASADFPKPYIGLREYWLSLRLDYLF